MEDVVSLQAVTRNVVGKQVRALRREGQLPAIFYGHHIDPTPIALSYREAVRVLPGVSSSQLIQLEVGGERHTALVREKQHHPVSGALLHVDFLVVSLTERLRALVRIELTGESPAVKNFNGIVMAGQEDLEVECLPGDLPSHIQVDISQLQEIGDALYVRDIALPPEVDILTDPGELVVVITAQEAEEEEVVEVVEEVEPEVVERGRKEEEEE